VKEIAHRFDDSAAYERFMGRWSRAAAVEFLDWIAVPVGAAWLDVGCGTGIFTELVLDRCAPSAVTGVDPSAAQVDHAARQPAGERARFLVADAQALPFEDAAFDVVASALVVNFIPDRPRAVREMRRVGRPAGRVVGYVWDFEAERSPSRPMRLGMRRAGIDVPAIPGQRDSTLAALHSLFEAAGLIEVETTSIEVTVPFTDFDDFWKSQTPSYSPTTHAIDAMSEGDRRRLMDSVKRELPIAADGTIAYAARANAIKARIAAR